jgi:hypothetical protein
MKVLVAALVFSVLTFNIYPDVAYGPRMTVDHVQSR